MNNQEVYRLFKDSKLAQVAKPLSKRLRGGQQGPTHQIIYTPKSSAIRSDFGIKSALPKQIGFSHIVYNDIDNAKNMPDVEKYAGPFYNRLKFQEMGMPVKTQHRENPLFKSSTTKTPTNAKELDDTTEDSVTFGLNLKSNASTHIVKKVLQKNPNFYRRFNEWMLKNYPDKLISNVSKNETRLVNEFMSSDSGLKVPKLNILRNNVASNKKIQGTGGFSYAQKGRLTNTPNGIKYGFIAPGRIVDKREAAIGGFIANINDHASLQKTYTKSAPGKHQRQFVLPFKITDAEMTQSGKVKLEAKGIQTGSWMNSANANDIRFQPTDSNISGASERMTKDVKLVDNLLKVFSSPIPDAQN